VARPLGGVVFGHYGDRFGRKTVLVWSLLVMGTATALIGLIPTYDRIGIWSPILLVTLRLAQGIGVGGEWGGAVLLAVEHSAGERRGFHGSWAQMGVPAGLLLSTSLFAILSALLPDASFLAWGWRVPFLVSVALIGVGLFVRLRVLETPVFEKLKESARDSRLPIVDLLRDHQRALLVGMGMRFAQNVIFYIYTVFVPGYGEKSRGYSRSAMLGGVVLASFIGLGTTPFWSHVSDRIGRRPVYLAGAVISLLVVFPCFWLIDRGARFAVIGIVLAMNVGHDMMYGPMAAYLSELFPTRVRYSGASLVYQLTSVFSGGLAPFVATLLMAWHGSAAVAVYLVACCALTVTASWLAPETHRVRLDADS
jgi:MFS family permease